MTGPETDADAPFVLTEVARHPDRVGRSVRSVVLRDTRALLGISMVLAVVILALAGPFATPYDPNAFVGTIFQQPSEGHPLGLDVLGRDVVSGLLTGGAMFLVEVIAATILGVGLGTLLGIYLAVSPRRASEALLAVSDTVLVLPQIVVALLVLTRLGATPLTLIAVIGFVHIPQTARVVLVATRRVVAEDYYAAARGLGSGWWALLTREIAPNIMGVVSLEFSIRLAISAVVLASLSYLGFATARLEWGRMIHENQGGLVIQPWAVMAPVLALGVFLIGANLVRDSIARALATPGS
jgi:peptide/nickel transport system permease protein